MDRNADLGRLVALSGAVISGLIAVMIIGGVLYSAIVLGAVPEALVNWGGIIIGFFFGQFFSFVRAVANVSETSQGQTVVNRGAGQ